VFANAHRPRNRKPFTAEDFMPTKAPVRKASEAASILLTRVVNMNAMFGGKDLRTEAA